MKQILQQLGNGSIQVADVPCPALRQNNILIRNTHSLISSGTERMLLDFGKANPLEKARQQPEHVRRVLEKVRTDGLIPTIEAVRHKLDQPLALGYCSVGVVLDVGSNVVGFSVGDRVASNGKHAQVVSVPAHLCARIPQGVDDAAAVFTVASAIALQGIRLAEPTLGETVAVIGLGLIGQLAVQLLRAQGCRVLAIDLDSARIQLASGVGVQSIDIARGDDPVSAAYQLTKGRGVDAVLLTAATGSSEPVHQAAQMCRQRGRIVLVGVTGLELRRADFYEKEISFQVSCSYGPGRYDASYEEHGQDYPVGFVRWTEQRNFEAVLDTMAHGHLDTARLISHRFQLADAESAYDLLGSGAPALGILLEYPDAKSVPDARVLERHVTVAGTSTPNPQATHASGVAFIGAGSYASAVLIPAFKAAGASLTSVVSLNGVSGVHTARKFGFLETTTDVERVLTNRDVAAVVIATRHDSHAPLVCRALAAGKDVFVEKPLALSLSDVSNVEDACSGTSQRLMVGFNRRFAPHVVRIKALLESVSEPKAFVFTVNAGPIPASHWTQDPATGGGRVIGEACHFVDLLRFLAGHPITVWNARAIAGRTDTLTIELGFADGSIGTIHYLANGNRAFPKERLEVFAGGRVLQLDNFRKLVGFGWPGFRRMSLWRQDKGQRACAKAFLDAVSRGTSSPIPLNEILEVSRISVELAAAVSR